MEWYSWIIFSVVLLVAELVTPGTFVSFFFAVGALLTGGLVYGNLVSAGWMEWLIFSGSAIFCYAFFHPQNWGLTGGKPLTDRDTIIGETVTTKERIVPQTIGKVTYRGALWSARNIGPSTIEPDSPSMVTGVKGLTLEISPLPSFPKITQNS